MPRAFPGLYWDEERKRYFPLACKPRPSDVYSRPNPQSSSASPAAGAKSHSHSHTHAHTHKSQEEHNNATLGSTSNGNSGTGTGKTTSTTMSRIRHRGTSGTLAKLRAGTRSYAERSRLVHELTSGFLASTLHKHCDPVQIWENSSSITAMAIADIPGSRHVLAGDPQGWLYWRTKSVDDIEPIFPKENPEPWQPIYNMNSDVSAISVSGARCVATSFGPNCKIVIQDLTTTEMFMVSPPDNVVHDIWSASLHDRSLVIGMRKRAMHMRDIGASRTMDKLDTQSDVLAVHQTKDCVYTGTRSGAVKRFDLRVHQNIGQDLVQDRYLNKNASVVYLNVINEWNLVTSTKAGDLDMFDLRFSRHGIPLLTFEGHVNSHTPKLGMTIDPTNSYIFAAGEDSCLRGWSMHSGKPLLSPHVSPAYSSLDSVSGFSSSNSSNTTTTTTNNGVSNTHNGDNNPTALAIFNHAPKGLQVAEDKPGSGEYRLWVTSGRRLFQFGWGAGRGVGEDGIEFGVSGGNGNGKSVIDSVSDSDKEKKREGSVRASDGKDGGRRVVGRFEESVLPKLPETRYVRLF